MFKGKNKDGFRGICAHCLKIEMDVKREGKELLLCSFCREVRYCSKECQKAAWHQHKIMCRINKAERERQQQTPLDTYANRLQYALSTYIDNFSSEIVSILSVPHFPLLHAKRREVLVVFLEFDWWCKVADESSKDWRKQFKLRDGKVITSREFMKEYKQVGPLVEAFKKYETQDKLRRQGLSEEEQSRLPAIFRLVCNARMVYHRDQFISERCSEATRMLTLYSSTVSKSAKDSRNLGLPWLPALKKSLDLPALPPNSTGSFKEVNRLVDVYMENKEWWRRGILEGARDAKRTKFADGEFDTPTTEDEIVDLIVRKSLCVYVRAGNEHTTKCERCGDATGDNTLRQAPREHHHSG